MTTYQYLQTAKITRVFDSVAGKEVDAARLVGDDEQALLLRTNIEKAILRGKPLYLCPVCFKPLKLRSTPQKKGQLFYHADVEANCPKLEEKGISQKHIRAIKYNGAKESIAHKEIKQFIIDSLNVDPNFSDIAPEKTWRGEVDETKFRRPDVRATYNGPNGQINIAFEVQLSTTFLSEIVGRSEFYRKENGLVIWILKEFDIKNARLTDLDIFYPNNLNTFVVNEETLSLSKQQQQFRLECHWAEPFIQNAALTTCIKNKIVSFKNLTLLQKKQQAFYSDYQGNVNLLQKELNCIQLSALIEEFITYCTTTDFDYRDTNLSAFHKRFSELSIQPPKFTKQLHRLIIAIFSLKKGKVILYGFNNLVQFGNLLHEKSKDHFILFLIASVGYKRKEILERHKNAYSWKNKKEEAWDDLCQNHNSPYAWDRDVSNFINLLFPELERHVNAFCTKLSTRRQRKRALN